MKPRMVHNLEEENFKMIDVTNHIGEAPPNGMVYR